MCPKSRRGCTLAEWPPCGDLPGFGFVFIRIFLVFALVVFVVEVVVIRLVVGIVLQRVKKRKDVHFGSTSYEAFGSLAFGSSRLGGG